MTAAKLLLRTILYHWPANLAVMLGCLVGAAVLTGALLVGDSMRGSLRALTLERLGAIDDALIGARFFRADLAERLVRHPEFAKTFAGAANVLLIQGSVATPTGATATRVNLIGTTREFWEFFPEIGPPAELAQQVLANDELAQALSLNANGEIVARFEKSSPVPKEGLMGERSSEKALGQLRLTLHQTIPTRGVGRFSLDASQRLPKNLFLPLEKLAQAVEQAGRANALFLSAKSRKTPVAAANDLLASVVTLDDYGVTVRTPAGGNPLIIESRQQLLEPALERAVLATAVALKAPAAPVLTYLANTIAAGKETIPYSIVTALPSGADSPLARLPTVPPSLTLKEGEILLNQWSADRLKAAVGASVRLEYFSPQEGGALKEEAHSFRLAGIVPMKEGALDRDFTPPYPGITNARNIAEWNPPFPINLGRIKKPDETYWDQYRTTPKAFVRLEDGRKLWTSRFGQSTSVRIQPPSGTSLAAFREPFAQTLLANLRPADFGLVFDPVKQDDLKASEGSTDFGMLFLAFSIFLILSAALLVALLFRLNVERRSAQIGILLATGLPARQVYWLLLAEGLVLAGLGSVLGLAGAVLYARLMLAALTSWWQAAVQTPFIDFYSSAWSFLFGWIGSVVVAMVAIAWSVRRLRKVAVPSLLSPGFTLAAVPAGRRRRYGPWVAGLGFTGGLVLVLLPAIVSIDLVAAFFGGATLLLVGALGLVSVYLRRPSGSLLRGRGLAALTRLGVRNGGRYPARSVLTTGLIGFATFVIVAIGILRHGEEDDRPRKDSGNGGFALVTQSAAPLFRDLNDADGRFELGIPETADPLFQASKIFAFRVRPGDDASCLNIYQPRSPTLLGAKPAFIERGGFAFSKSLATTDAERANPWRLLERTYDENTIPAIGDANTLEWILKVTQLGQDLVIQNERGQPLRLRIVAWLSGSVFQGELLVREADLLRHFPSSAGNRFFLVESPPENAEPLADMLRNNLGGYGMEVETTAHRIAQFKAVENTYMAAFQTLGGLGLILGTLGLGTVLARNVLERRGELAVLRAIGFRQRALGWLVLAENLFLLLCGLALGTGSALVAVLPQLLHQADRASMASVFPLLLFVLLAGIVSGLVAVVLALRTPLLLALRTEG